MKKVAFALVATMILMASCGKKSDEGTHIHEDGSTHEDHASDTTQEEFNAADSVEHSHDSTNHDHPHSH